MQPVRHALGALLLEQGQVSEALDVYRADLGYDSQVSRPRQHLDNVWSLSGYVECLERTGQEELAGVARQRLNLAQARADTTVQASCFLPPRRRRLLRLVRWMTQHSQQSPASVSPAPKARYWLRTRCLVRQWPCSSLSA